MQKFIFVQSDEEIMPIGGLPLIGALLNKTKINERINIIPNKDKSRTNILNSDIIRSYIGLLCQAKNDFEYIEEFREDPFFRLAMDIKKIPSCSRLRQRLNIVEHQMVSSVLLEECAKLLKKQNVQLTPCIDTYLPLDLDVSPFDNSNSKKEGVGRTYKGCDGFAPMFAYLGEEGYQVNVELREGTQHCQKNTPEFLLQSILYSRMITDEPILVRMDSGNDSIDNIIVCTQENVDYIIKRNLRGESKKVWLIIAEKNGTFSEPRDGKKVYRGTTSISRKKDGKEYDIQVAYEVIERTIDKNGQILLEPEIEVSTYWYSLKKKEEDSEKTVFVDADTIISLYQDHGTSEQFHSEIKSDMDLERLPSGKFETNNLILHLALVAYNLLRIVGQSSLKKKPPIRKKVARKRIRTIIRDLIMQAAKLVKHARKTYIKFGQRCKWFDVIRKIYQEDIFVFDL